MTDTTWTPTDKQVEKAGQAHQLFNRVPFPPACSCGERMPDGNVRDRFNEHMADVATAEKAAEALWRASQEVNGFAEEQWAHAPEPQRASWRHQARAVLAAVLPEVERHAKADALREAGRAPMPEGYLNVRAWLTQRAEQIEKGDRA